MGLDDGFDPFPDAGTFQLAIRLISLPATYTRPLLGRASRSTRRRKVDLPEPDAPTRKTNSPFSTSTETSARAARLCYLI